MKNLTRIFLSSLSLILVMAYSARSQSVFKTAPVGIGIVHPAQALDIQGGNIRFTGALMPGVGAGTTGNIFISGGALSSSWNGNGTIGEVLISSGGVPTWGSANSALSKSNIVNGGATSVVVVANGIGQVVGNGNVILDIQGNAGGILYGKGTGNSAVFSSAGTSGQILTANGTAAIAFQPNGYWSLTGNAGTNPAINFVGTISDEPVRIWVANTYSGSVDPQFVGVVTSGNTALGAPQTSNDDYGADSYSGGVDEGTYNTALGNGALGNNATGINNVAIGYNTNVSYNVNAAGSMSNDVSIGLNAMVRNVTGSGEIAIGENAMRFIQNNSAPPAASADWYNTAVGNASMYGAGSSTSFGVYNTAEGYESLYSGTASGRSSNTAIGSWAAYSTTSSKNVAVGDSALYSNTSGAYNTALGYFANVSSATWSNATAIGYSASAPANNSITLGSTAVNNLYLPGYNTVGSFLYTSVPNGLVASLAPGNSGYMLQSNGTGAIPSWNNVIPSSGTVTNITGTAPITVTGSWLIGIRGTTANAGGILYSAGSGSSALFTSAGTTGQVLQSNGTGAPSWTTSVSNTWNLTGNSGTNPAVNFVGTVSDEPLRIEVANTYAGSVDPQVVGVTTKGNTALGTPQSSNGAYGADAYSGGNDEGIFNTAIGCAALGNNATGNYNVALGYNTNVSYSSGTANSGSNDVSIGYDAMVRNVTGSNEVAIGENALRFLQNVGAPPAASADWDNTAIGFQSMYGQGGGTQNSYGAYNTVEGYEALYSAATSGRASNTAVGSWAAYNTTASRNTAIGDSALYSNTSGGYNTALGYQATVSAGTITNATAIGSSTIATATNTLILGNGSAHVGINTSIPQQMLETGGSANTIRIDALRNLGSYNKSLTVTGNIVYVNSATGDLYSLPNGATGTVLSLNTSGVPAWTVATNSMFTTQSIVPGAGSDVVIGNGTNQVVGASNVIVDVQGTTGGIFYGAGAGNPAAFTSAGTSAQVVLTSHGTGAPTWAAPNFNAWLRTGNTGTTPVTNYLGTDDDKQFRFYITGQGGSYNGPAGSIDPQLVGATAYANTYLGGPNTNNGNSGGAGNADKGTYNVGVGFAAMGFAAATATYNVAIGSHALEPINEESQTGSYNVSIGASSNLDNGGASYETAIGTGAMEGGIATGATSNYNTAIGYLALASPNASSVYYHSFNTALGYHAIYTPNAGVANSITGVGTNAAYQSTGNRNTAIGDSALYTNTTGIDNTALGYGAGMALATLSNATAIGYNASAPVNSSITLGNTSVNALYVPGYNTVGSLYYTSAPSGLVASPGLGTSGNLLESQGSGSAPTWANITPGSGAVTNVTGSAPIIVNGTWNINIQGTNSNEGGILYSNGSGTSALFTPTGSAGQFLTSTGTSAPTWQAPANALWNLVGNSSTNPTYNWFGTDDGNQVRFYVTGQGGSYNGPAGSIDPQFIGATAFANIYLGGPNTNNGNSNGAGNKDVGTYNVGLGFAAMGFAAATATYNVAIGSHALEPINEESQTGSYNVSIGASSNLDNGGASYETAIGTGAMEGGIATGATSNYNTAIGYLALASPNASSVYYHSFNTALGYHAIYTPNAGVANSITGVGTNAAYQSTGNRNTAIGDSALYTNTTGIDNTALGYGAGMALATLSNATAIGYNASAPVNSSITLGNTSVNALYVPGYNTVGSLLYTSVSNGLVASTGAGTSGYHLQSNGPGFAPSWANIAATAGSVASVTGDSSIVVTPVGSVWEVGVQGNSSGTDKGGVLYSQGANKGAIFTPTPAGSLYLTSSAGGAVPTWATYTTPAASTWQTTGNTGTIPGTNFLGTTNANRLIFETDGLVSGTIDLPTTAGGNGNCFYGFETGYKNTGAVTSGSSIGDVGTNNTAFGYQAFQDATSSATGNIALGWDDLSYDGAGAGYLTGSYNIGFGTNNLYDLTSGNGNIGISAKGEHGIETGSYNTAIGYFSCTSNVNNASCVGSFNTDIGYYAQYAAAINVLRASSTAVGYYALESDASSSRNTSVGSYSLNSLSTGTYELAVGDSAFFNIAITGANNSALGCLANTSLATMSNSTVVGARAYASTSNEIVLGDINGTNGATANTNVSIGTNTPATDAALAIKTNHLETQGQLTASSSATAGTVSPGVAAGSGATTAVVSATDVGGQISFTSGSSAIYSAGPEAVITFANSYTYSPIIVITPANAAAAAAIAVNGAYTTSSTTGFDINFTSAASASTQYAFNYYVIETPGTSPTSPTIAFPSYTELCQVPITLTNNQSSATSTGYQQMITINSSLYSANEMSGLQNIVFTTAAPVAGVTQGTVLNTWIESGNTNTSTSTVYWVNLGSTTIPANSSITIYMNIVSSNVLSAIGPTGEAPQLSGTYAQYDNGSSVFNNYWNFAGSSLPAGLTKASPNSYGTITFNNLCTLSMTTTGQWGNYMTTSSTITPGTTGVVVETYANNSTPYPTTSANAMLGGLVVGTSATFNNATSYAATMSNQTSNVAGSPVNPTLDTYNFDIQTGYEQTVFPYPALGYSNPTNTNYNIYSLGINSSGNLGFGDINYTNLNTVASGTSPNNKTLSSFYIGFETTQNSAYYQWLRTRTYPPAGVMPTAAASSETCP